MSQDDPFDDLNQELDAFGIFHGAEGVARHYAVQASKPQQHGVTFRCRCDNCGAENAVNIGWAEMHACSRAPVTGALPHGWRYDPSTGRMWPHISCAQCRREMRMSVTPDEASRLCHQAVQSGIVRFQAG